MPRPDPAALMAAARHYRDQGDIEAAVIQLKMVIQQDADNRSARLLLGELYIDPGDPQSAEKERCNRPAPRDTRPCPEPQGQRQQSARPD